MVTVWLLWLLWYPVETSVQIAFHVEEQLVLVHLLLIFNVIYPVIHIIIIDRFKKKTISAIYSVKKGFVQNLLLKAKKL